MGERRRLQFDVASALDVGKRETQEDAIVADFPIGNGIGIIVLSDGMGGHSAGEVASKIAVTEVYSDLKLRSGNKANFSDNIGGTLRAAAESANICIRHHTDRNPETAGMGATLIAAVRIDDQLHWLSIGDSVLFLFRKGRMIRLNEDHSLAPQIDYMVNNGMISEEAGRNHPDRNCLTSALCGDDIPFVDCPEKPLELRDGDVVIAASDGLMFLENKSIARIVFENAQSGSEVISQKLLSAIAKIGAPDQDNLCFSVVKVQKPRVVERSKLPEQVAPRPKRHPANVVHAVNNSALAESISPFLDFFRRNRAGRVR